MAGPGGDGDLRRLLKLHRTEIAMAVDDVFPLLHGLADHDVVPEHIFKETLSRAEREGSQRAFHALLTWLLGRDAAALRDFWAVLFKDYNLERYARLRPVRGAFPRGTGGSGGTGIPGPASGQGWHPGLAAPVPGPVPLSEAELGRQRRGRRLSPSPTAPAPHRPQGKRKAPEERDKARAAQPSPRHTTSPGMETPSGMETGWGPLAKAKTVKKPEGADTPRTPRAGGECQPPLGSICLCPLFGQLPVPTMYSQQPVPLQENEDECAACGDGGELICCDGCPRAFHLTCLVPPLPRVPSGTWRCGSCVTSVAEPGQLLEADVAVQRPLEIAGEEGCDTRLGGADGSVCSHCFTRIPTPQHCPAPSAEPRGLLLCTSCARTPDMGSLDTTTAAGDQPAQAAKAEEGALSSDPVLSRDELDALLGEGTWDGILQWAFQSMARPLADTHGLLA
ncbi:autoimmune regulator [Pseudopipra pipra]|uniref:autoimmune regulator n=1 Tax=Pseudopipra pipra TaxID=415032 RepID=UPI003138E9AF